MILDYNAKLSPYMGPYMHKLLITGLILAGILFSSAVLAGPSPVKEATGHVKVAFGAECDNLLLDELNKAEKEILVAIFSLTHPQITKAFISAVDRGVKVEIKYDLGQKDWIGMKEAIDKLEKRKIKCIPVKMSGEYAGMHHKFTVIDRKSVLTGSFNYSSAGARNNYENLVLISSEKIAAAFTGEYKAIKDR